METEQNSVQPVVDERLDVLWEKQRQQEWLQGNIRGREFIRNEFSQVLTEINGLQLTLEVSAELGNARQKFLMEISDRMWAAHRILHEVRDTLTREKSGSTLNL